MDRFPQGWVVGGITHSTPSAAFGNQSDWSRNVRAAGGCSIRLNGVDYRATRPELADWAQAAPFVKTAYHPVMRGGFRMLGIKQFLLLTLDDR